MYNIQPIIDKILDRIEAHKVSTGRYARWIWQSAAGDRELGVNPYGCADAANLLYMLGRFPRVVNEREEWIEAMQEMQDKESGLFHEKTHHPLHTTAHVTAALELFDAAPKYRPTAALPCLEEGGFERLMDSLNWKTPWPQSHQGAGIYVILNLCGEATKEWNDNYFKWFWDNADPETGFWRKGDYQSEDHAPIWHYMAGGFHYMFNHESAHMPVRYPERIIDSCIKMYREGDIHPKFGQQANFIEVDWIYCLTRASEQTCHRFDEVRAVLRDFTEKYLQFWNTVDWEKSESVNDLHLLFGGCCALAELQRVLRGELRSDKPLKLVLDRRPFI